MDRFNLLVIVFLSALMTACGDDSGGSAPAGSVQVQSASVWTPTPGSTLTTDVSDQGSMKVLPLNDSDEDVIDSTFIYGFAARLKSFKHNNEIEIKAFDTFSSQLDDIYVVVLSSEKVVCGGSYHKAIPFSQGFLLAQYLTADEFKGLKEVDQSDFKRGWMFSYQIGRLQKIYRPFSQTRPMVVDAKTDDTLTVSVNLNGANGAAGSPDMDVQGTFVLNICPEK